MMDKNSAIHTLKNKFEENVNGIVTIGDFEFTDGMNSIARLQFLLNSCKLKNCTEAHFLDENGCQSLPVSAFETLVGQMLIVGHDKWEILYDAIKRVNEATTQEDIDTIVNTFTL